MKRTSSFVIPACLALFLGLFASVSTAQQSRPIGGIQEHRLGAPFKPLYAGEVKTEIQSFGEDVDQVAASVEKVTIDASAPKDEIERQIDGALSLNRHRADLVALRDRFSLCTAAMENHCADKMESGKATDAEKKAMADCMDHCKEMLAQLDGLHHNTSALITATRKTYLLNSWAKHQKMVAELKSMTGRCPMMFDEMIKASGTPPTASDAISHDHSTTTPNTSSSPTSAQVAYACPMHAEVAQEQPGRCPKCGMNLTKKE